CRLVAGQGGHAHVPGVGSGLFRYVDHDVCLFLAPDHPRGAESEPGVSFTDGPGRLGMPVLQQRDHLHGGESAAPQLTADVSRLVGPDHRAGCVVPLGHNARMEQPDWQVGPDHQPQFVRQHVFHSGWFSRLARDHWRDRDEHCVRPGVAPANHGAERDRRGSRLLVLALCGWCLGGGLHFGVCRGTLSRNQETRSMTSSIVSSSDRQDPAGRESVEMPRATAWPIVLALGVTLLGAGLATSLALSVVGAVLFVFGLGGWIGQLLPGRGHRHEPLVEPALRPQPITEGPGTVDHLRPGMAGYRFRLPEKVHPISAGVKGGIVGGLVMPIPALAYGLISGHGLWFPVNLLAGMVVPGISGATEAQLEQFYWGALILAVVIHATFSVSFGLLFGVVSPTLPPIPGGPVIAGGVLMPLLWTGLCHGFMGIINPLLQEHVNWPWFIASQVVYGLAMSVVVIRTEKVPTAPVGGGPSKLAGFSEPGGWGGRP